MKNYIDAEKLLEFIDNTVDEFYETSRGLCEYIKYYINQNKQQEQKPKFKVGDKVKIGIDDRIFNILSSHQITYQFYHPELEIKFNAREEDLKLVEEKPFNHREDALRYILGHWMVDEGELYRKRLKCWHFSHNPRPTDAGLTYLLHGQLGLYKQLCRIQGISAGYGYEA